MAMAVMRLSRLYSERRTSGISLPGVSVVITARPMMRRPLRPQASVTRRPQVECSTRARPLVGADVEHDVAGLPQQGAEGNAFFPE